MIERSRSRNIGAAVCSIASHGFAAERSIQSIEQKCLIVVHLYVSTETGVARSLACRDVVNSRLLGVDFDEGLRAGNHHGAPAGAEKSNISKNAGRPVLPKKKAGIVGRVAIENRAPKINGLPRCANG